MSLPESTALPITSPLLGLRTPQGRRVSISREELIDAALHLVGPHRSISNISLREVAREAGIAPNSFYRHFRDVDELAIALIERAGTELRSIIGEARQRASPERSVVQSSMEVFMEQLRAEHGYLQLLLREGKVGSVAFKQAVDQQLCFFEQELQVDLVRLEQAQGHQLHSPELVAKAITRLVFAMGASAVEQDEAGQAQVLAQTVDMLHMIIIGSRAMVAHAAQ
ncbi:MAG: HTH-type transcriptional repressor FabR [Pseudomonadota bacterium]|nr:HTH-type transcriptional repressor FabR [Pseudomonadota bacterium]